MRDDNLQWFVRVVFYAGMGVGLFLGFCVGLVAGLVLV